MVAEQVFLWTGLILLLLAVLGGIVLMIVFERMKRDRMECLERELGTLKQTVGALCSSAVGVDKRVNRIERHGRDLKERQENIEHHQHVDPPYSDAIRMVKEGADAEQLVEKLGLTHGAADLILMIHGMKDDVQITD